MLKFLGISAVAIAVIAVSPKVYSSVRSVIDFNTAEKRIAKAIESRRPVIKLDDLEHLTSIPKQIGDIEGLEFLSVSGTRLNDISSLSGLSNLKTLQLAETRVSDLSPLVGNTKIETLDIGRSRAYDLEPLSNLPRLKWLQMDRTATKSLCPLRQNRSLDWLNLYSSYAEDGSHDCFKILERRVDDLGGGNSYKQNYIPGSSYKSQIAFKRFLEDWEWR